MRHRHSIKLLCFFLATIFLAGIAITEPQTAGPAAYENVIPTLVVREKDQYHGNTVYVFKEDGSLWAWGNNSWGIAGSGTQGHLLRPVKIMDGVSSVVAGEVRTYAIKTDGSLWGWGIEPLGTGTEDRSQVPIKIMDNVKSVYAGYMYTLVIRSDNSLWAWGINNCGQLGDGTFEHSFSPVKVMDDVYTCVARPYYALAIRTDGSLWFWGERYYTHYSSESIGSPIKVMDNVADVRASTLDKFYVLKKDGTLWAWGRNSSGELGDGTTDFRTMDNAVEILDNVRALSGDVGNSQMYAIKEDGSLWGWGAGDIGDGTYRNDKLSPVKIMDDVVFCAPYRALKSDGSLWTWGQENGTEHSSSLSPVKIMDNVAFIAHNRGESVLGSFHILKKDGSVWAWGYNGVGQLGNGKTSNDLQLTPTKVIDGVKMPAAPPVEVKVTIDGRPLSFDVPAQIINGRTMVPLRAIFEEMGATIEWDGTKQTATAKKGDNVVVLTIGSNSPTVNGRAVPIDQPGVVINGRTLAPLRFVAEAFGGTVQWDASTNTAQITKQSLANHDTK